MTYPYQPGDPRFDGADAYEAYLDQTIGQKVTYATEAEARADWATIAPAHRTECRLKFMLSRVRS
jgi:hypothetical protein